MRTLAIRAVAAASILATGGVLGASARAGVVIAVGVPGIVAAPPVGVYPPRVAPPLAAGVYPRPFCCGYHRRYYRPAYFRYGYGWGYGYRRAQYRHARVWH